MALVVAYEPEEVITAPEPAPTREGYKFAGWSPYPTGAAIDLSQFTLLANLRLYAVWQRNPQITCIDGERRTIYTADAAGHIAPAEPDSREGYVFECWQLNGNCLNLNEYVFTADNYLQASWLKLPVVNFVDGKGNVYKLVCDTNYLIAPPEIPALGSSFIIHWTHNGQIVDFSQPLAKGQHSSSEYTYYAVWALRIKAELPCGIGNLVNERICIQGGA